MRPDTQQRRRSRGGSRRPRRGDYHPVERTAPPKKQGFIQKILAFFTGSNKSKSSGSTPSSSYTQTEQPRRNQPQQSGGSGGKSDRFERVERPERTSRKPEIIEVSSPKLYVGNLSFDASESDLYELFNGVGKVQNAEIVSNKYTQKSKGFAFVTLQTIDEARRAVTELHDKDFMGRKLVVSGAKTSDSAASRENSRDGRDSHDESADSENGNGSDEGSH